MTEAAICARYGPPDVVTIGEVPKPVPADGEVLVSVTVAEQGAIATIPGQLSDQDAVALCFGGTTALNDFGLGKLAPGETVLINGASGAVGVMAVQLAKHVGAEVTAVCSGANTELVGRLGADHVIDYTKDDFTRNAQRYDVIMDNHGNAPYSRVKGSLKPGGRFLMVIGDVWQMLAQIAEAHRRVDSGHKVGSVVLSFAASP